MIQHLETEREQQEEVMDTIASMILENCCPHSLFCREGFFEQLKKRVADQIAEDQLRTKRKWLHACEANHHA